MRVVRERRTPCVQHQRGPDLSLQVLGVGCNGVQRLSGDLEQQAIDHGLVVVRDVADGGRRCEDHMVVTHRQEVGLAFTFIT